MKTTSTMPATVSMLLIGLLLCSGCDNPVIIPAGGGGLDYLPYLQSMTKVSVTFTGETLHHAYLKQGCLDPGNTSDLWLIRQHEYQNRDSAYTIIWEDSFFSTKACFILRHLTLLLLLQAIAEITLLSAESIIAVQS